MGMKKMAAVLLAVVMTLCLLPTAAFAAGTYLVYLNDAWLDAGETVIGDGKVTLDVENKTLTIENVALTDFVSFEATEEFTLIVKGTNTITPEAEIIGIGTSGNLPALNIVLEGGRLARHHGRYGERHLCSRRRPEGFRRGFADADVRGRVSHPVCARGHHV